MRRLPQREKGLTVPAFLKLLGMEGLEEEGLTLWDLVGLANFCGYLLCVSSKKACRVFRW